MIPLKTSVIPTTNRPAIVNTVFGELGPSFFTIFDYGEKNHKKIHE